MLNIVFGSNKNTKSKQLQIKDFILKFLGTYFLAVLTYLYGQQLSMGESIQDYSERLCYAPLLQAPHFLTKMLKSNILYYNLLINILSV